jgi:hypothetical protein
MTRIVSTTYCAYRLRHLSVLTMEATPEGGDRRRANRVFGFSA